MSVTDEDREKAWLVLCALPISIPGYSPETVRRAQDHLAAALAAEREKARAPFLTLAEEWDARRVGCPARGSYDNGLYVGLADAARGVRELAQDQQ